MNDRVQTPDSPSKYILLQRCRVGITSLMENTFIDQVNKYNSLLVKVLIVTLTVGLSLWVCIYTNQINLLTI
jgi:hypothetical protein